MTQALPCLHPHPGWNGAGSTSSPKVSTSDHVATRTDSVADRSDSVANTTDTVGKHCILELYECDAAKLDDEAFIRNAITTAAKRAGATLLNLITHHFDPQGVTGLALLAESHISIHTWPESGYAAVDVFTCGDHTMPEKACATLAEELSAGNQRLKSFRRLTPDAIAGSTRDPILPTPTAN